MHVEKKIAKPDGSVLHPDVGGILGEIEYAESLVTAEKNRTKQTKQDMTTKTMQTGRSSVDLTSYKKTMQTRENQSSGNTAFDEYREETLHRLEEEQGEFESFLERLRQAKDKAEFDQFMTDRRSPAADPNDGSSGSGGQAPYAAG